MPRELVERTIEDASHRDPVTRAMVLLCASRVLAGLDQPAARRAFTEGLRLLASISFDQRIRSFVFNEAVCLGSTADPVAAMKLFRSLPPQEHPFTRLSTGTMLVQALAKAGEFEAALNLLEDGSCEMHGAGALMHYAPELTVRVMAAARERWRRDRAVPRTSGMFPSGFYSLLSENCLRLDPVEAQGWLDEALAAIEADPDHATRAEFGKRVRFDSMRDMHVFQLLNVIRRLRTPEEAQSILSAHPAVAAAAEIYPFGLESVKAEPRPAGAGGGGFMYSASGSDARRIPLMISAHRGDTGAIEKWIEEAHHVFSADIHKPNSAPRVFWPSCHAYKIAMYYAGKAKGMSAEPLLRQIPDTDIALAAAIELAAGVLGLNQYSGLRLG
jgi:hypothetical protein